MNPSPWSRGCLILALAWLPPVLAQSNEASEASAISVAPSVEAAAVVLGALPAGSELVVRTLRPVGDSVEVVFESVAAGVSFTLHVAAATVASAAMVVGATLVVTAVAGGFLLSLGAELVAFVPDALTKSLIHSERLTW